MPLITQAEYARHRGISQAAVKKAVDTGRIKLVNGKVDREKADQQWAQNTDPRQQRKPSKAAPAIQELAEEQGITIAEATRLLELEKLRKLKAENDRIEGKTLDAEDVRRTWERHREAVKNWLLLISSKVPPTCREQVDKEVRAALEELSELADVA